MTARTFAFAAPIGLSAFLLFTVEPLVGRLALPIFGGTPAVWATTIGRLASSVTGVTANATGNATG